MANPVDRISDLPESILSDILSRLTTRDSVATSVLSRSWRFRWTHVSSFNFDNSEEDYKKQIHEFLTSFDFDGQIRDVDAVEAMGFEDFVDSVLLRHSGESINEFVLVWESADFRPVNLIRWASIALGRNLRRLDLKTVNTAQQQHCEFRLPSSLYSSGTLEELSLGGPFRVEPPKVVSLPKLSHIVFVAVIYESDESLPNLISGCAVLRSVLIRRDKKDNLVNCVISCPVLKLLIIKFENIGGEHLEPKLKIDTPALERLYLNDICSHISMEPCSVKNVVLNTPRSSQDTVFELLQAIASVKFLTLTYDAMVAIERAMTEAEIDRARATLPRFERVANLSILRPHRVRWSTLICLVDSCVRLEELAVWCVRVNTPGGDSWRDPAFVPRCLLSSLNSIALADFHGSEDMMSMLKYFLEHGLVLERVRICCQSDRFEEILEEVSQFPKASSACDISWFEYSAIHNFFQCF